MGTLLCKISALYSKAPGGSDLVDGEGRAGRMGSVPGDVRFCGKGFYSIIGSLGEDARE